MNHKFIGQKSIGTTYLLFLLFGLVGFHRFYLGKIGTGVIYIFTFGLFGIGLIYDLFMIPSQVNAYNTLKKNELGLYNKSV